MKKIFLMLIIGTWILGFSGAGPLAQASVLPYVDTGFVGRTIEDLDLVVARENYNPTTFQQSIYFRAVDNRPDTDVIGADIVFSSGVRIIGVQTTAFDLLPGDLTWGISGAPYTEDTRGLEMKKDVISWTVNSVSMDFDFLLTTGVDDIRVIVDYGDFFAADQSFAVTLHQGEWQGHTYNNGIQIGVEGSVPGSGDRGEVSYTVVPLTGPATVPEPATMLLLGCGLAGLTVAKRCRRNG